MPKGSHLRSPVLLLDRSMTPLRRVGHPRCEDLVYKGVLKTPENDGFNSKKRWQMTRAGPSGSSGPI